MVVVVVVGTAVVVVVGAAVVVVVVVGSGVVVVVVGSAVVVVVVVWQLPLRSSHDMPLLNGYHVGLPGSQPHSISVDGTQLILFPPAEQQQIPGSPVVVVIVPQDSSHADSDS